MLKNIYSGQYQVLLTHSCRLPWLLITKQIYTHAYTGCLLKTDITLKRSTNNPKDVINKVTCFEIFCKFPFLFVHVTSCKCWGILFDAEKDLIPANYSIINN